MSVLEIYEGEKRKLKRSMVAVGIISMMASICLLAVPLYLFQVYDRVIFSRNLDTLIAISMIAVVVLLSFGFLDAIRNSLLTKIGVEFEAKLSGLLLGAELSRSTGMQRQSLFYLAKIRQVIASNVFPAFFDLPVMIVFVLIVFAIHPILGGVVVSGIVVLSLVALLSELFTGTLTRQAQEAALAAQKRADAAFRQHETVKAMGLYREIVGDWSQDQSRHLSKLVAAGVRNNSFTAASRTIRQIIQIVVIVIGIISLLKYLAVF